jgi:hypothetical protein
MTEIVNSEPTTYDDASDIGRLNDLLDKLTDKRFSTQTLVVACVRAALDLHGITLPILDVELGGSSVLDGKSIMMNVTTANDPEENKPPEEGEWIWKIRDSDGDKFDNDWDDDIYFYLVIDKDEDGLYSAYAQLISPEELRDLHDDGLAAKVYPELVGDLAGETEWNKLIRHTMDRDED